MRAMTRLVVVAVAIPLSACSLGQKTRTPIADDVRGPRETKVCFEGRPDLACFRMDLAWGRLRPKPTGKTTIQHSEWFVAIRRMDGTLIDSVAEGGELAIISPDAYARRNPGDAVWHILGTAPGAKAVKTRFGSIHLPIRPVGENNYMRSGVSGIGLENSDSLADDPGVDEMDSANHGVRPKGRVAGIASDGTVRWTADDVVLIRPGPNGWAFAHAEAQNRDGPQTLTVTDENFLVLGKERATNYASFNTIAPPEGAPGFERRVTTAGQGERLILAERLEGGQYRVVFPGDTASTTPDGRGVIPILRSANTARVAGGAQRTAPESNPAPHSCTYKMPHGCVGGLVGWVLPVQTGDQKTVRFADPALKWATGDRYRRFRLVQFDGVPDAEMVVAELTDGTAHVLRASHLPGGTVMFLLVGNERAYPSMALADQAAVGMANQAAQTLYARELVAYQAAVRQAEQQRRDWERYQSYMAQAEQRPDAELCGRNNFTDAMQQKAWSEACSARRNAAYEAKRRAEVEAWSRSLEQARAAKASSSPSSTVGSTGSSYDPTQSQRSLQQIDRNLNAIKDPNRSGAAAAAQRY